MKRNAGRIVNVNCNSFVKHRGENFVFGNRKKYKKNKSHHKNHFQYIYL